MTFITVNACRGPRCAHPLYRLRRIPHAEREALQENSPSPRETALAPAFPSTLDSKVCMEPPGLVPERKRVAYRGTEEGGIPIPFTRWQYIGVLCSCPLCREEDRCTVRHFVRKAKFSIGALAFCHLRRCERVPATLGHPLDCPYNTLGRFWQTISCVDGEHAAEKLEPPTR
jgi:hypothetical protein